MLTTPLVHSVSGASFIVALAGFPWAIACWAPFAFMGVEVNRLSAPRGGYHGGSSSVDPSGGRFPRASVDSGSNVDSPTLLHLKHHDQPRSGMLDPDSDSDDESEDDGLISGGGGASSGATSSTGETAGIYLGVLNVFTTLPQFVGTFISMIVFAIFEPGKSKELAGDKAEKVAAGEGGDAAKPEDEGGVNAISICLFIGGACALVAAYATTRLRNVRGD